MGVMPTKLAVAPSFSPGSYCCFFLCVRRACMRAAGCATMRKCGTCQSATGVQQRVSADYSLLLLLCSVCERCVLLN